MIGRTVLAVAASIALHATTSIAATPLAAQVTSADGWVAWSVPMVADAGAPCCYVGHIGHGAPRGCDLDGRRDGFTTSDDAPASSHANLTVYAHVAKGKVDDVRGLDANCPVRSAGTIRRIDDAAPDRSVAFIADWIDAGASDHIDDAIAAIALHEDASATALLAKIADAAHPRKQREPAIFWLGQARGADGAAIVERFATSDADPKLREHAIFALTESHAGDSYAKIHAISGSDASDHVRSQALFWMAQMHDPRAKGDIIDAITRDASPSVREQGVFALSQLKSPDADAALIALIGGSYPREVKKQALFWLGQSGSPEAIKYFDEALSKAK
jgi:HEAT repeat protein